MSEPKEYILKNANGLRIRLSEFGGIVMEIHTPDKKGQFEDIALGFDSIASYHQEDVPYFGALIGRYGNRISKGRFSIDGVEYHLAVNNGSNHLHGGLVGFDKVRWQSEPIQGERYTGVRLQRLSADGEEGYPGNLEVIVDYKLTDENEWIIEYKATTDKSTILNLTQHSYFNLGGSKSDSILDHEVLLHADSFTPVDENLIPTGEALSVADTPLDFRSRKRIGLEIDADHDQLRRAGGYDHNFIINVESNDQKLRKAAKVLEPASGRTLEVMTTEPGVQFYTGNFLDGSLVGKNGASYKRRSGFCLETQHYPDSPNQPMFPSTRLEPGEAFESVTIYRFGVV